MALPTRTLPLGVPPRLGPGIKRAPEHFGGLRVVDTVTPTILVFGRQFLPAQTLTSTFPLKTMLGLLSRRSLIAAK